MGCCYRWVILQPEVSPDVTEGSAAFWMAEQQRIVFRAAVATGFLAIDLETGNVWPLDVGEAESVVLSPDNSRIYVNRWESESDIWMLELRER